MAALAARPGTFVLTSGERVSGELTYKGGTAFTLNGRDYPSTQVAIIAFQPGDPTAAELNQLPPADNPADEHNRHMIVTRDGQVIHMKLYHISPDGEVITFDPLGGNSVADRRDLPASQIARIYITPSAARIVYANILSPPNAPPPVATTSMPGGVAVPVYASQPWTDSGMNVKKGDRVAFHTSGTIRFANTPGDEAVATPDGNPSSSAPRSAYPVLAMPVGGLIGRVGSSAPFPIGSNNQPITMPANGRLYLGINDNEFSDNSGVFAVSVVR